MQRNLTQLADTEYDLLVIGGGIHGACIAWDAALRGLSVALIDRGDFGGATSANSLKTVHGGLRYLQDADLGLVRLMIRERRAFARIAPHLVHPLPCVMPTSRKRRRSKPVMAAALMLNDIVGFDRNRLSDPQKHLPRGRIISRDECLRMLPGIDGTGITGGAVWYDYQIYNTERFTLAIVRSAAERGATVANYVEATSCLAAGTHAAHTRVAGVRAVDTLTSDDFTIRAKVVVNAAGASANRVLGSLNGNAPAQPITFSTAMNLVTRQIISEYAAGISSHRRVTRADGTVHEHSRLLFVAPWRTYSIIGTDHAPLDGPPGDFRVTEEQIGAFLDEFNRAYPGANLMRDQVRLVHSGFLPAEKNGSADDVTLVRKGRVYDHRRDGIDGLLTVAGVKYTTARATAEDAVNAVFTLLGYKAPACTTHATPIHGGDIARFETFLDAAIASSGPLTAKTVTQLAHNYGAGYQQVTTYLDENACWGRPLGDTTSVIPAEVVHGIRDEMAQTLADVVFRRTELGSAGHPGAEALRACADVMAGELGWNDSKTASELAAVEAIFAANS